VLDATLLCGGDRKNMALMIEGSIWPAPSKEKAMRDSKYRIVKEFCGYVQPRYVVRFQGRWVGQAGTRSEALALAVSHEEERWES
jgi:nuclear transport factor 2 (NTF2) superfamily protein